MFSPENFQQAQSSSALSRLSKRPLLILSTVKNVENVRAATDLPVIDEVLSGREALYSGRDGACGFTRVWMLSEQPETIGDVINYAVRNLQACVVRPV